MSHAVFGRHSARRLHTLPASDKLTHVLIFLPFLFHYFFTYLCPVSGDGVAQRRPFGAPHADGGTPTGRLIGGR